MAGEEGQEGPPEGVHVGADARRSRPGQHFGRGVQEAGVHGPGTRAGIAHRAGDAEVGQLGLAVVRDQHVVGLDVPVQHLGPVCGLEGAGQAHPHTGYVLPRQGPVSRQHISQRATAQILHDQEASAVGREPGFVNGDDVGMGRRRAEGLALPQEPGCVSVVQGVHQDLDRHLTVECGLPALVHHAEGAPSEHGGDLVTRDVGPERWPVGGAAPTCSAGAMSFVHHGRTVLTRMVPHHGRQIGSGSEPRFGRATEAVGRGSSPRRRQAHPGARG